MTAKNVLRDAYRARASVARLLQHCGEVDSSLTDEDRYVAARAARDELGLVVESFKMLSPQEVDSIVLKAQGFSIEEIIVELAARDGKKCEVGEAARGRIRQAIWRARAKIKKFCKESRANSLLHGLQRNKVNDDDEEAVK